MSFMDRLSLLVGRRNFGGKGLDQAMNAAAENPQSVLVLTETIAGPSPLDGLPSTGGISNGSNSELSREQDEPKTLGASTNGIATPFARTSEIDDFTDEVQSSDDLDELLNFESEEEPEEFFRQPILRPVEGSMVVLVSPALAVSDAETADWDLDLSTAKIDGEGISVASTETLVRGNEHDFLKVQNRGRQSGKRAVVQTGTRLSIKREACIEWAEEILAKGWVGAEDIESLVACCEGNGDAEELYINLERNLEAAGFAMMDTELGPEARLWDAESEISANELAEAIEAALSRSTRLPGTQRFLMDRSEELRLLEPMIRAKQELLLGVLASEPAVEAIIGAFDSIRDGLRDPRSVSLRNISTSRTGHGETEEVMAAVDSLRSWQANGRVMDGKRRREALAALEALDLSSDFYRILAGPKANNDGKCQFIDRLDQLVSLYESSNEHLIIEHLPYARRFASRNVEEGEDPEDVFQVAYMGLQRSTRRFDPERGYRFAIYATYWMRQFVTRWRLDEGAVIRIPVHRSENLAKFERAKDKLDIRFDHEVSDQELAVQLEWESDEVRQFRLIPREAVYPDNIDEWDDIIFGSDEPNTFDRAEIEQIVGDALAELPDRQADVIRRRFGIGNSTEMTLEEIGQIYGVTRERIRQIEAKGLRYLSHPGRKRQLQTLLGM